MSDLATSLHNDQHLRKVCAEVATAVAETVAMITARPTQVLAKERGSLLDIEGWLWLMSRPKAVIDGSLTGSHQGLGLGLAMDEVEAVTLAATLREAPDAVIEEHRKAGLRDWHAQAFEEVCQLICQAVEHVIHEELGSQVGLERRATGMVRPGYDPAGVLGEGERVIYDLALEVEGFPGGELQLILDPEVARLCNQGEDPSGPQPVAEAAEELPEQIPQAAIRGRCSAFLCSQEVSQVIKGCARRVGLEVDRRPRTEIPNPAAYHDELLVIEVPVGEERRFDWAKRIKMQNPQAALTLLIHEPSRARVIRGLLTKADIVLAWPCREPELSEKLARLLDLRGGTE